MTDSEQSDSARRIMAAQEKACGLCGRRGTRGFMRFGIDWVCSSARACERRVRATGEVGIGCMRGYRS